MNEQMRNCIAITVCVAFYLAFFAICNLGHLSAGGASSGPELHSRRESAENTPVPEGGADERQRPASKRATDHAGPHSAVPPILKGQHPPSGNSLGLPGISL